MQIHELYETLVRDKNKNVQEKWLIDPTAPVFGSDQAKQSPDTTW